MLRPGESLVLAEVNTDMQLPQIRSHFDPTIPLILIRPQH
jgi:hypothetical protein